jgi:hypothetical protein
MGLQNFGINNKVSYVRINFWGNNAGKRQTSLVGFGFSEGDETMSFS